MKPLFVFRSLAAAMLILALSIGALGAETVADALRRGDAAAARTALESQIAGRKDAGLHRAHLEGLIAMRQGDYRRAAEIFRAILAVAPGFEPSRLQLAAALERQGKHALALVEARHVAAATDDIRLRDRLLAEIAAARGDRHGGIALRFSLLPSTNLTGGTSARTVEIGGVPFTLDPASREAAGIGLSFGATGWHYWDISAGWRATLSASADARLFRTELRPDETELGLRLDISRQGDRSRLTFGPRIGLLFQDGARVRSQAGVGATGEWLINRRLRLGFSVEWLAQKFPRAAYRDGTKTSASLSADWALAPNSVLSFEIPMQRETAKAPHLAHTDFGFGMGFETRLKGGTRIGVDLTASRNTYDGAYPGFAIRRRDTVTSLRLSVSDPNINWKGLVPEFSVTRKHQDSNIPLHDSWTTDFGLSFSRRF